MGFSVSSSFFTDVESFVSEELIPRVTDVKSVVDDVSSVLGIASSSTDPSRTEVTATQQSGQTQVVSDEQTEPADQGVLDRLKQSFFDLITKGARDVGERIAEPAAEAARAKLTPTIIATGLGIGALVVITVLLARRR